MLNENIFLASQYEYTWKHTSTKLNENNNYGQILARKHLDKFITARFLKITPKFENNGDILSNHQAYPPVRSVIPFKNWFGVIICVTNILLTHLSNSDVLHNRKVHKLSQLNINIYKNI